MTTHTEAFNTMVERMNRIDTDFQRIILLMAERAPLVALREVKKAYESFVLHARPYIKKYAEGGRG